MNIAVIAHAYHPIKQPFIGGLEAHTNEMVAELTRQGHEVTIFAKAGTKTAARLVTIFRGNAWNGENPLVPYGYRRAMRIIRSGDYDLIINNSLNYEPLKQHDVDMPPMITIFHTPPFPNLIQVLERQLSRANRTYIAVSEFTAKQWQKHCADQVHVVPNGMNLSSWKCKPSRPSEPTAAWIGRITPEKGTHVAIEACIAAGMPLKLGGPAHDRKYFKKRIRPLLRNPLIEYVGHLDHAGVNKLFSDASVALVTPLWDEPFGLVEIEAWASGTPVAALPNGALPSLMRDDVGSLADSDSAVDLVTAMQQALKADRSACRKYAEDNFSLTSMVESYLSLMPQVVNDENQNLAWQPAL